MSDLPTKRTLTENPWFWAYLFSMAGLIGLVALGQKADAMQAQRDGNFTRRQHSLELQAQRGDTKIAPIDEPVDDNTSEARYVNFAPFYALLGGVVVVSWIMVWREHFRRPGKILSSSLERETV